MSTSTPHEVLEQKSCDHNTWDNVRVSKQKMTLRCRLCQSQWRLPVGLVWNKVRCTSFDAGTCRRGASCRYLHVFMRKVPLEDRVRAHGVSVLGGVNQKKAGKLKERFSLDESTSSSSASLSQDEDRCPRVYYRNDPYSWDRGCAFN
eukprot:TRINITY_DN1832_c0_g1_i2.p1 TRINITY_DN1832_c0_g1~~TRINITY_DN1832_c0_g1_i2.p1  ORF type:complete len:169 (+),score=21.31 TRINITY_DN1832_c0_g1_i2:68-508(+)